jgi:hypothetical protein
LLEKGTAAPNTKDEKSNRTILEEILSLSQLEGAKPIIIVPNGQQNGNLCLKNAKSFLVDGK